jgi:hypothetical protein
MKTYLFSILILNGLLVSCYKPYFADTDTDKTILVVNGLITNQKAPYNIKLSYATPFYSAGKGMPVKDAIVYVTDNLNNNFTFYEQENGQYVSDSLKFTGHIGYSYYLHIKTSDGENYESDAQQLFPEVCPDSVYAEFSHVETLSKITGLKEIIHGGTILSDINNKADTLPRFRIVSNLVRQYYYYYFDMDLKLTFDFYCWQTDNPNPNIDLTGGEYLADSASVNRHDIGFVDDGLYFYAKTYYRPEFPNPDSSWTALEGIDPILFLVHHRIIYLKLYTLNKESYLYYKSMDVQLKSEGKLFDPIATQLKGNIKCTTDPNKKAFGFFEASSVNLSSYMLDFRNLTNSQPSVIKRPYFAPSKPNGCWINKVPPFWIFI